MPCAQLEQMLVNINPYKIHVIISNKIKFETTILIDVYYRPGPPC